MGSKEYIQFCKEQVVEYFNSRADKTDKKWENKCIPATAQ